MKIAICIKEVFDARLPLQVLPESGQIEHLGTKNITLINPADRAALEVALRLRRRIPNTNVKGFSVCAGGQEGALHFALARGADSAERIEGQVFNGGPPATALLLAARFARENFDLIFCGDETLDNSSGMVGPLVAELLDLPQVTSVCDLQEAVDGKLILERILDRGHRELVEVTPPALVTFVPEAAEPEYVSLRRLNEARKKEIPLWFCDPVQPSENSISWPAERLMPPRARVRKKFAPDATLSPADRVKMIMSGGMGAQAAKENESILEGDADYLSEKLFRFLKHHEFV